MGLNPLIYVSRNSNIVKELSKIKLEKIKGEPEIKFSYGGNFNIEVNIFKPRNDQIIDNFGKIYDFVKLYFKSIGEHRIMHFSETLDNYQNEMEWRYIPKNAYLFNSFFLNRITKYFTDYERLRKAVLAQAKHHYENLEFDINDIEHIIVEKESEKKIIINEILKIEKLIKNSVELNLLFTKIISFELLENDFLI